MMNSFLQNIKGLVTRELVLHKEYIQAFVNMKSIVIEYLAYKKNSYWQL